MFGPSQHFYSSRFFDRDSIQTYHVWASSDDDWGVRWDGMNIEVLNKHKQFYRVGIRPDWRLLQWDNYVIQKTSKTFISTCLQRGVHCDLKFNTDNLMEIYMKDNFD